MSQKKEKKQERINYSTVEIRTVATEAREYTGSLIIASFIFLYPRRVARI